MHARLRAERRAQGRRRTSRCRIRSASADTTASSSSESIGSSGDGGEARAPALARPRRASGVRRSTSPKIDAAFVHESAVARRPRGAFEPAAGVLGRRRAGLRGGALRSSCAIPTRAKANWPCAKRRSSAMPRSPRRRDALGLRALDRARRGAAPICLRRAAARCSPTPSKPFSPRSTSKSASSPSPRSSAREHIAVHERDAVPLDDPKTLLQEWTQRRYADVPAYAESFEGPPHERVFHSQVAVHGDVLAAGSGRARRRRKRCGGTRARDLARALRRCRNAQLFVAGPRGGLARVRLKALKALRLQNVRRTDDARLSSRGITGLVGPNGSGKSNLVDAIRWVLGEQSSKSLRTRQDAKTSSSRATSGASRSGMAEVSLTFDNAERRLAVDSAEVRDHAPRLSRGRERILHQPAPGAACATSSNC